MATDTSAALQEELLRRARARAAGRPADPGARGRPRPRPRPAHPRPAPHVADGTARPERRPVQRAVRHPAARPARPGRAGHRAHRAGDAATSILRTRYGRDGEEPYQETLPAPGRSRSNVVEATGDGDDLLAEEARRPVRPGRRTPSRAPWSCGTDREDHTVLLTFHHIAIDGGSLETVAEEIAALYAAAVDGRPCELPEPPQYADFARREHTGAARLDDGLAHWTRALAGATPPRLPRPAAPPADVAEHPAATRTTALGEQVLPALRELGRERRATVFTVALAAAFAALHRLTGETDLVIGCAATHREGQAMRGLVGLCVNTLPVRVDLSGDPGFATLVERVRDALLAAQQHRDVPFDLILERLGAAARGDDGTALVRVTSDVVGEPTALRLPGLDGQSCRSRPGRGQVRPHASASWTTDAPRAWSSTRGRPSTRRRADALAASFAELLTAVAADPELRLSRLPGRRAEPPAERGTPGRGPPAGPPRGRRGTRTGPARRPPARLRRTGPHRRPLARPAPRPPAPGAGARTRPGRRHIARRDAAYGPTAPWTAARLPGPPRPEATRRAATSKRSRRRSRGSWASGRARTTTSSRSAVTPWPPSSSPSVCAPRSRCR